MKQRYICCAYISTNSKIYNILHKHSRRHSTNVQQNVIPVE